VIIDGKVTWPEDRKVTLENVALGAYLHVPGGTLQGHISSDQAEAPAVLENVQILAGCHLTNVVLGEEVTVAKGITLEGIITNQGGNVLEDVQLEGNTVVSEGKLKGNIIGKVAPTKVENQSPVAVLKNLEVLAGSHLNNVTIGKNVILAEDVILENVKLPAHFAMKGGQLQGIIIGKEEAPARLDNVTIVAGSYLENMIIGNNVTLAEDVSFGKAVCLGAWGTDALRQPVDTQACFIGHLVVNDMPHTTPAMFANQEMDAVKVAVTIKIDPAHLGKTAEIVIWAEYNSTLVAGKGRKYARDTTCDDKGLCWQLLTNDDPSQLPTAVSYNSLPDTIEVPIYTGRLNGIPGEFTVYAGYRLSDGTLVYNGRKPIHFMVGNSASIDLQQGFRSLTSNDAKKTSYFTPWVKQEEGLARVRVDARDVGKPADILMVAVSRQQYYTRHGDNWQRWDEKLASLQPAQHFAELPGMLAVPIHQERLKEVLSGGDVTVYVGYRLEEDKVIVFNGVAPIHFVVAE
jgi:hypothetical protein